MNKKPTDDQLFDNDAREFMRQVMVKVAEGQTASCYFTFGIKPPDNYQYKLVPVAQIQDSLIATAESRIAGELASRGRCDLHVDGLLPESVTKLAAKCIKLGYQFWTRKEPKFSSSPSYYICVEPNEYCKEYYIDTTEQYREAT